MYMTNTAQALLNLLGAAEYFRRSKDEASAKVIEGMVISLYKCNLRPISSQVFLLEKEGYIKDDGTLTYKGRQEILNFETRFKQELKQPINRFSIEELNSFGSNFNNAIAQYVQEDVDNSVTQQYCDSLNRVVEAIQNNIQQIPSVVTDEVTAEEVVENAVMA